LSSDYCEAIVPCDDTTCFEYCQNHNYKNFQTYCTMGKVYPICCCRVPDEGTTGVLKSSHLGVETWRIYPTMLRTLVRMRPPGLPFLVSEFIWEEITISESPQRFGKSV
jgi:hypothetical protein